MAQLTVFYKPELAPEKNYDNYRYIQGVKLHLGENVLHPTDYSKIRKDSGYTRLRAEGVIVDPIGDKADNASTNPQVVKPKKPSKEG